MATVLIVIGSIATVVVLVIVVNLIGALMSYGDNVISRPATAQKSMTPHEMIVETLGWARDTAEVAGGTWTYGDGTSWDPHDTTGYTSQGCGGGTLNHYEIYLESAGSADPLAAAKRMMAHWKKLGYSARYVGSTDPSNGYLTQIAADLPNGAGITFAASNEGDTIIAYGQCSADRGLLKPSK
ncbi:MAG: hypothetical protein ABI130_13685 [Leifsonia sp.]